MQPLDTVWYHKRMLKDFKQFILRGNVVDLAVAVVIGGAFGAIVTALVKDLITPLIAAIGGQPDFSGLYFTLNGSKFMYGEFLNAVISFLILAAVIFFFVVQPINKLIKYTNRKKESDAEAKLPPSKSTIHHLVRVKAGGGGKEEDGLDSKRCPYCLSEIPKLAGKCAFCTSEV